MGHRSGRAVVLKPRDRVGDHRPTAGGSGGANGGVVLGTAPAVGVPRAVVELSTVQRGRAEAALGRAGKRTKLVGDQVASAICSLSCPANGLLTAIAKRAFPPRSSSSQASNVTPTASIAATRASAGTARSASCAEHGGEKNGQRKRVRSHIYVDVRHLALVEHAGRSEVGPNPITSTQSRDVKVAAHRDLLVQIIPRAVTNSHLARTRQRVNPLHLNILSCERQKRGEPPKQHGRREHASTEFGSGP